MKLTPVLSLALAVAAITHSARAQGLDYSHLVSFWPLNGNVADNFSTNNGTFVGTTKYGAGPITNTQAASLDGKSYVNVGTNIMFDANTPFSATAWIKGPVNQESAVIGKMVQGGNYTGWELHIGTTAGGSGAGKLNVWLINDYGANYIQVNAPAVVLDNTWHHVAFTYDGSSSAAGVRIFVDGADNTGDIAVDSLTGSLLNTVDLDIGCRQDGANHVFQGAIAQVSVWSTNLTATNISSIYQNGIHPSVSIYSLLADNQTPYAGQPVTLTWQVDTGTTLSFDQGIGDVTALTTNGVGSLKVAVETNTTFTLTATKSGRPTETRQITLTVQPLITAFTATRNPLPRGLGTLLAWTINPLATNVSLAPTPGDISKLTTNGIGSLTITPTNSQTYTLTVARNGVTNQAEIALAVVVSDYARSVMSTPGLLGYWRFDSPAPTNSWANGFTGTNENDAAIGPPGSGCPLASEPANQALMLPGNGGYLASDLFGGITNEFTLMAWINMPSYPGSGTNDGYFEIIDQQTFGDDCDLITFPDGTISFYTDQGGSIATPNPIPVNEWHFIVGTAISGGPRRIYVDGQLVGENVAGPHYAAPTSPLWIGYSPVFTPRHFVGSIDEAAAFNRALSGTEVATIYLASGPTNVGTPQSISLSIPAQMSVGAQRQASVALLYSSGAKFDVTDSAIYASSDTNVLTVSAGGLVTAHHVGSATVTASYQGFNSNQMVTAVPLAVPPGYPSTVYNTPGLVGYWRFDEPVPTDSWINGFTGTIENDAMIGAPGSGCPLASDPTNQALVLPGNGGYLATDLLGGVTNDFTLMAWINMSSYPGSGANDGYFEIIDQQTQGDDCDLITFPDGTIHFYTDQGGSVATPNPIPVNEWHFIVGTMMSGGPRNIYVDGQLVAASIGGLHVAAPDTPLWIGYSPIFTPRHFVGSIDEAAIFNRALSAWEVAAIYLSSGPTNLGTPQSISLSISSQVTAGLNQASSVTLTYSSGTNFDVTGLASYASSDTNVLAVGATGVVAALQAGSATITASYQGLNSSKTVTVIPNTAPDTNSLISLWPLNGNTRDVIGHNDGKLVGTTNYVAGPKPNALAIGLDGNSFIIVGTNVAFDAHTPFSATAWIKGDINQESAVIGKMVQGGNYTGWELHIGSTAGGSGPGLLNVWLINTYGSNYIQVNATNLVLDNTWHHVAFTYDGSSTGAGVRIFVDGNDSTSAIAADTLSASFLNSVDMDIACRDDGAIHIFQGAMSEVSIWNTNLSPQSIAYIFQTGVPAPPSTSIHLTTPHFTPPSTFAFNWNSVAGKSYRIEDSLDLLNWTAVETNYPPGGATGVVTSYTNSAATQKVLFYRVRPAQ